MADQDCIFCQMVDSKIPTYTLNATPDLFTILSLENHPLIIPKQHLPNIYSLNEKLGSKLMQEIVRISKATKKALDCDGIRLVQLNEMAAGQEVFHLHFHVIPCWSGSDQIDRHNQAKNYKQELLDQLKSELDKSRTSRV